MILAHPSVSFFFVIPCLYDGPHLASLLPPSLAGECCVSSNNHDYIVL